MATRGSANRGAFRSLERWFKSVRLGTKSSRKVQKVVAHSHRLSGTRSSVGSETRATSPVMFAPAAFKDDRRKRRV